MTRTLRRGPVLLSSVLAVVMLLAGWGAAACPTANHLTG